MTFLEELAAHKGGLVLLKTELFWYGGRGYDGIPKRVCLLMDSVPTYTAGYAAWSGARSRRSAAAHACLLIDGRPHWVCIAPADVELL
jgi:hypothetical protein